MDVITAIFHNFRPQAALRALLRLQSAVSPRRPHRGARDRERRGYASARMVRSRRLLLGLCLGWQAAACGPSEPGATDKPARPEALTEAEVDEPDLRALLRLDERSFPLTVWAAYIIQNEYFDKQRLDPRVQLVSALTYLGLHTPEFFAAVAGDQVTITVGSARQEFSLAGLDDLAVAADRLEMILGFAQAELKLEPEATHKLEYVAINGLLAPLDPHTLLLTPEEHSDLGVKTRGQFGGIGAEIREDDRRIRIVKVLPGSPAEKAGLQSGDLLLQIDKQSTVNLRDADAQQLLRGPIDTEVVVKVRRGEQTLSLTITRQIIRVESVTAELLPGQIAYLRLLTFQENTGEQVRVALKKLAPKDTALRGVILDLRDNTGGLLTQAVEVLDGLVASGELVIVRSAMGREFEPAKPDLELPLSSAVVALINEESASASEIVSGSVKYLERGLVLGRPSFGKGTVQLVKPENFYGSELALKITIAEYLVAGDRSIQTAGVQPDLLLLPVELSNIASVANYYDRERFERRRESTQVAHLPSAKHEKPAAAGAAEGLQLRYLASPRGPAKLGAPGEGPAALRDPEVRIAHEVAQQLVGEMDTATRQARLAAVARDLTLAEDAAIAAAIAATKIDWQGQVGGQVGAAPSLGLVARIVEPGEIRAGDPFTLRVEVRNDGPAPVDRVHVLTDCPRDELDGIELLIGHIEPGQTQTRDLSLHVMGWHTSFTDTLRVDLHAGEPDKVPDAQALVRFDIVGQTRPHLTYDYWIVDDPALAGKAPARPTAVAHPGDVPFAVRGNGDGNLQPGEQVLFAIEVGNAGPGPAADTRALIRNLSGAQTLLEEGFVQLGPVPVGGKARGSFGLTVNPSADPALPVTLDVVVADVALHQSVRHKLKLGILPPSTNFVPESTKLRVGGEPVRVYNAADSHARQVGELAAGAQVEILGQLGGWSAVSAGPGRRFWLPGDLLKSGDGKGTSEQAARAAMLVHPPVLAIEPTGQVTSDAEVELRGTARHPVRVHDVLVTVKPPGVGQIEQKVAYEANSARQGDGALQMSFSARVPLVPGSNQILVTARDAEDVEVTREVWVFRREGGNLGPAD
jgi:carboxyl-terminal processing protease